jgi:hypothetical protein
MIRDDLSAKLIHLTKGKTPQAARDNFENIMKTNELIGNNGDVRGGAKCVCFSEAPISKIALVLAQAAEMRYAPLGVIVDKIWIYGLGGRPVIYQSGEEFDLLPDEMKHRHVRYEPNRGIDYSWEREWRLKIDKLPLNGDKVTYIVPTRAWVNKIVGKWDSWVRMLSMAHMPVLGKSPGPFIILEDLGVPFNNEFKE